MDKLINKIWIILILVSFISKSQNNSVESARVAFISQKINLTSVQAEKFWPLFNDLANKKNEIRKSIKKTYELMNVSSEQTVENTKKNIENIQNLKSKEIQLEREYFLKYLQIITPKQFTDLLIAEKEFQKILIKKVAEE
ncbi:MAG: hypothetical protein U0V72_00285 [Cytophagales bacterium]